MSRAFIVEEAVALYVEDHRAYLAAIDEAVVEADMGGFVPEKDALAWLRSLGIAHELPMPVPGISSGVREAGSGEPDVKP